MAIEKDAAAADAEFASVLAELEADQGDDSAESATPGADSVEGDPEAGEEPEETEEEDLEAEPEAEAEAGGTELKAELAELLDAGDLKGLAEKLGVDPSIFKLNNKQFKAARVTERNARAAKAEAERALAAAAEKETAAVNLRRSAEEAYGTIAAGSQGYRAGDYSQTRAAIELLCQDTLENVVANLGRAAKGLSPAEVEVRKLRKEMADREAATQTAAAAAAAAAEESAQVAKIAGALKKTPLAAVKGADAEVWAVMKASLHPTLNKYTKTLKEAYEEVKATHAARAAAFGVTPARRAAPPERRTIVAPRSVVTSPRKLTKEQEWAAELAAADKAAAAQDRKIRRSK